MAQRDARARGRSAPVRIVEPPAQRGRFRPLIGGSAATLRRPAGLALFAVTGALAASLPARVATAATAAVVTADGAPEDAASPRQSTDDAWWTGPLLAASASTLPQGHALVEPYLYDSVTYGRFSRSGTLGSAPRESAVGSLAYLLYGLTDAITVGLVPRFGVNETSGVAGGSGAGVGDLSIQAQYQLTALSPDRGVPAISLVVQETLPTGAYDRLDTRPEPAFGAGAYTTAAALYSQDDFWMPNGRILRARLDLSYSGSGHVTLVGASVYGTPAGFGGRADPGDSAVVDAACEYSATRNWVLAVDLYYEHDGNTQVEGSVVRQLPGTSSPSGYRNESGTSQSLALAPAVEFNWSARAGVIVGAKAVVAGRNTAATVAPVAAVNLVF